MHRAEGDEGQKSKRRMSTRIYIIGQVFHGFTVILLCFTLTFLNKWLRFNYILLGTASSRFIGSYHQLQRAQVSFSVRSLNIRNSLGWSIRLLSAGRTAAKLLRLGLP